MFPETKGSVITKVISYLAKQMGQTGDKNKSKFEKGAENPATTSGHLQLHALITCNSGQHFAGNSELFPV